MEQSFNQGNKDQQQHAGELAILELGISYLDEISMNLNPEAKMPLIQAMSSYLSQTSTYEQAKQIFLTVIGRNEPLDKLHDIVEQPDDPPNHNPNSSPSESVSEDDQILSSPYSNSSRKKTRSWTPQEDTRLLSGIYKFGTDNWTTISVYVGNGRTRAQCCQRWTRGLNPRISKNLWSYEEDMKLVNLVHTYGDKSWTRIASMMGNRSDVQCRYHYHQVMRDMPPLLKKMMTTNPAAFACDNGLGSFMTTNPLFHNSNQPPSSKTADFLNVSQISRDSPRAPEGPEQPPYNQQGIENQLQLRYSLPQICIDSFDGIMTDTNVRNNVSINSTNLININSSFLDGPDNVGYNLASLRSVVSQPMFLDPEEMSHTQQTVFPQKAAPYNNNQYPPDIAFASHLIADAPSNSFSIPSNLPLFQHNQPSQQQQPHQIQLAPKLHSSPNIELTGENASTSTSQFQTSDPHSFSEMANINFLSQDQKTRRSSHSPAPPQRLKFPSPHTMVNNGFAKADNIDNFLNNFK